MNLVINIYVCVNLTKKTHPIICVPSENVHHVLIVSESCGVAEYCTYNTCALCSDERVGQLVFTVNDASHTAVVRSQMEIIVRQMWSNPPAHGARVVANVLNNPALTAEW